MDSTYSFCFLFCIFGMVNICQALTCTSLTSNTCTKSLYVTGNCVSGVCQCANMTRPSLHGCRRFFKPTVSAEFPSGAGRIGDGQWSHEANPGSVVFKCYMPSDITFASIKWYRNGQIIPQANKETLQIWVGSGSWLFQCSYFRNIFRENIKSDEFVLDVKREDQPFRVKPVVLGVPKMAPVNFTFTISCSNIPSFNGSFVFNLAGKEMVESKPETYLTMTEDVFNTTVSCSVRPETGEPNITSDLVSTPATPAVQIPEVFIEREKIQLITVTPIVLKCVFKKHFNPDNVSYTWIGPNGTVKEDSEYYIKTHPKHEDAGLYRCKASYNNFTTDLSPEFNVTVNTLGTNYVMSVPKNPVIGGHISMFCKTRGYSVPSYLDPTYSWNPWALKDSVIQINNITVLDLGQKVSCGYSFSSIPSESRYIPAPIPMSKIIQPIVDGVSTSNNSNVYMMSCESDYITPGTIFEWYVNGNLQPNQRFATFNYSQSNSSSVNVKCRLSFNSKNSGLSQDCRIPGIDSITAPVIEVEDSPKSFIAAASYQLKCSCLRLADATYSWKRGGLNLTVDSFSLRLENIGVDTNGNYTCTVTVGGKSLESNPLEIVALDEIEAPVIKVVASPPVDIYGVVTQLERGSTYYLLCSSPAHYGGAKYDWPSPQTIRETPYKLYRISDADVYSDGFYTCNITIANKTKSSNPFAIRGSPFTLPSVYEKESVNKFIVGGDYDFECETWLVNWPGNFLTYRWKKGDTNLKVDNSQLSLRNVQTKDNGNYTCDVIVGNRTLKAGNSLSVIVTNEGKYCTSGKNCTGSGFSGHCYQKVCDCKFGYHIDRKECVDTCQGTCITYTGILVALTSFLVRYFTSF